MVRIFDIIPSNIGQLAASDQPINGDTPLYKPNNLGGGFSRDEAGNLTLNNENISFTVLFKTDAASTGYAKYLKLVETLSNYEIVWLRYGIPNGEGFTFAYRPGYVSSISKTEGTYANASLVEQITITTIDSWFKLYEFTPSSLIDIHPDSAINLNDAEKYKVFDREDFKAIPYAFPYWYKRYIIEEALSKKSKNWFNKFGNVLLSSSDKYGVFAIHAPSFTISPTEKELLGSYENDIDFGLNRIKANSFVQQDNEAKNIRVALEDVKKARFNFKAKIQNYDTISLNGPFAGEYTSFYMTGRSHGAGCELTIDTPSGIVTNKIKFKKAGYFILDTAPWANVYSLGEHSDQKATSQGIDFSSFVKTTANMRDKVKIINGEITRIIMRRSLLCV